MKKTITSIDPLSAAKVMAMLYFIITIPFMVLMLIISMFTPGHHQFFGSLVMLFVLPFVYAVFGFIFTLIGAWLYNIIAKMVGGIQYTSTEV